MFSVEETGLYAEVVVHETTDHTSAVDVVLYGLSIVLPLMNIDMLRVSVLTGCLAVGCSSMRSIHDNTWTHGQSMY